MSVSRDIVERLVRDLTSGRPVSEEGAGLNYVSSAECRKRLHENLTHMRDILANLEVMLAVVDKEDKLEYSVENAVKQFCAGLKGMYFSSRAARRAVEEGGK